MSRPAPDHWRDRALCMVCRHVIKPGLTLPLPWWVHRRGFSLMAPGYRYGRDVAVTHTRLAGLPTRVFTPNEARDAAPILWLHGGGFVIGSSRSYRNLAGSLARATGRRVVMPDYRLAPEHPYPAGPDDCLAAARALAAEGPFVLAGDSAGGCFALTTLASLLAEGIRPERLILASPAVDLDPDRPVPDAPGELLLPVPMLRRLGPDYVAGADPKDPRLSPIYARYPGGPPTLVFTAEGEILQGDGDAIVAHLRAEGAAVEQVTETGVPHVWMFFAGRTPKADSAITRMADFLA